MCRLSQDDASCNNGVFYVLVQILLQLCIALLTGVLYATPWSGSLGVVISLITLQAFLCCWTVLLPTGNDAFGALDVAIGYLAELTSTILILASNLMGAEADGDTEKLASALQLAVISSQILVYSAFFPMLLTAYDSFLVPLVRVCWKSEVSRQPVSHACVCACVCARTRACARSHPPPPRGASSSSLNLAPPMVQLLTA